VLFTLLGSAMLAGCVTTYTLFPVADLPIDSPKISWEEIGSSASHTEIMARQGNCADDGIYLLNHTRVQQTDGYLLDSSFIQNGSSLMQMDFYICAGRYYHGLPSESGLLGGRIVWLRGGQEIASIPLHAVDHVYNPSSDAALIVNDTPEVVHMNASAGWTFVAGDQIGVYITGGTDTGLNGRIKLLHFKAEATVDTPNPQ
jgi:hypothetical protein